VKSLEFYPSRKAIRNAWGLTVFFAFIALLFLWFGISGLIWPDTLQDSSPLALVGIGAVTAVLALIGIRASIRTASAKANHEPQLVVDKTGLVVRSSFSWKPERIEWVKVSAIDVIDGKKGVTIGASGDFGKYGRHFEIDVDDPRPAAMLITRSIACPIAHPSRRRLTRKSCTLEICSPWDYTMHHDDEPILP